MVGEYLSEYDVEFEEVGLGVDSFAQCCLGREVVELFFHYVWIGLLELCGCFREVEVGDFDLVVLA